MAKKMEPRGEAKKRATSNPVPIAGRRDSSSSRGLLGEGGRLNPMPRDVVVVAVVWMGDVGGNEGVTNGRVVICAFESLPMV